MNSSPHPHPTLPLTSHCEDKLRHCGAQHFSSRIYWGFFVWWWFILCVYKMGFLVSISSFKQGKRLLRHTTPCLPGWWPQQRGNDALERKSGIYQEAINWGQDVVSHEWSGRLPVCQAGDLTGRQLSTRRQCFSGKAEKSKTTVEFF